MPELPFLQIAEGLGWCWADEGRHTHSVSVCAEAHGAPRSLAGYAFPCKSQEASPLPPGALGCGGIAGRKRSQ